MKTTLLLLLLLPILALAAAEEPNQPAQPAQSAQSPSAQLANCNSDKLVVYKVTFATYWDRERFPRQYPEWRPPAQWSKLVGFSHSPGFHLFQMGQTSSDAVKEFAETGETDVLEKNPNILGSESVLDNFNAPPIEQGVGRSHAKLFVDGNHTMISLMSKLVPSPDWFVGLDSLNLCENGRFVDSVTIEADPMDAGTDNGFTFTSPNWPTTPLGVIFRITNTYPTHPAGSFYYPDMSSLPTIASFTFVKEKEYELSEVFHTNRDSDGEELLSMQQVNKYSYLHVDGDDILDGEMDNSILTFVPNNSDKDEMSSDGEPSEGEMSEVTNEVIAEEAKEEASEDEEEEELLLEDQQEMTNEIGGTVHLKTRHNHGLKSPVKSFRNQNQQNGGATNGYHASTGPNDFMKKKYKSKLLEEAQEKVFDKNQIYEQILETYKAKRREGLSESLAKKLKKRKQRRLRKKSKQLKEPRHCKVGPWSEWGPCSKSCGIGESARSRVILKHPKRGGKECPSLDAVRWCGSARNCRENYFNW